MTGRLILGGLLAASALLPASAHAEVRALVIAADYSTAGNARIVLANPLADALILENALDKTVIDEVQTLRNPDFVAVQAALDEFTGSLDEGDTALFYFAGHGFQVNGVNYLLTGDGKSLVSLDSVMRRLTDAAGGVIVVIDACRNNPFVRRSDTSELHEVELEDGTRQLVALNVADLSSAASGLAQVGDMRGLSAVVFFSTEPGNVAEDGETPGLGSPFARVFAEQIVRRQSLDEVFRRTAVAVNSSTDGRQSPWRQGDLAANVFLAGMRALPVP